PLICAAAHALLSPSTSNEMMYMPGGLQTITPFAGGIDQPITVQVDVAGAFALQSQLTALKAKGKSPYFDFEHADGGASFWPSEFFWSTAPAPGIYVKGEWTTPGKEGVEGKTWRQFSPVFHVDNKRANPSHIVCNPNAKPNMGGLVNDPAFANLSPLWAKNAGGAEPAHNTDTTDMDPKQLEALQAKNTELTNEIARLNGEQAAIKAKGENTEFIAAKIELKESQLRETALSLANAALQAKNSTAEAELLANRQANAKAVVQIAVERGAIAAKDADTIAQWEKDITADQSRSALLAKMLGAVALGSGRLTSSNHSTVSVTAEAPNAIIKEYAAIVAKNSAIPLSLQTSVEKGKLAREAAAVFAKDIAPNRILDGMSMDDAIKAADFSDSAGQVGLLSGTLVIQRSLSLMQYKYPLLSKVTSDFSDAPGLLNQTENTRIILAPAVQTYSTTLGTDGRPAGWSTASPAQAVDVPITLDTYYGIPIVFGIDRLASTMRDLFGEVAPMALYALGGAFVNKLTALMTAANFNAYKGITDTGGATTNLSATIVVTDSTLCYPGQFISGTGIPANSFVKSITDATHVVLSAKASATGSSLTLTLGTGKVPTTYTTYAKALADFSSASYADLKAVFSNNEVPQDDRWAMLNSSYYGKLSQDPIFNFYAAMQNPTMLTKGILPEVQGFESIDSPFFPTANYGVGFAGHKAGLVIKTRLPQQLSQSFAAAAPGSVTTVTDPNTGISVSLVQFWNLMTNAYEWRPEVMVGAAVGDRRGGMLLTSQ
ncbi:MAG: phage protease, partial [Verrucomicrobiota bacterium]